MPRPPAAPGWQPAGAAPPPAATAPSFGRAFPVSQDSGSNMNPSMAEASQLPRYDGGPGPTRAQQFGGAPPPPPPVVKSEPPPDFSMGSHSVSIVMPAPDGSMMAPLSSGTPDFVIVRHGKRHGPYDKTQLERLIPMGKLRSVDTVEVLSNSMKVLAVDIPGLRPLFEERARAEEKSVVRPMPTASLPTVPPTESTRSKLWGVIGVLALAIVAFAVFLALR